MNVVVFFFGQFLLFYRTIGIGTEKIPDGKNNTCDEKT